jgi:hypothetical protein
VGSKCSRCKQCSRSIHSLTFACHFPHLHPIHHHMSVGSHPPGRNISRDLYSLHAFSSDGTHWNISTEPDTGLPSLPYSKMVDWSNGTRSYMSRMERPQLVLDPLTGHYPLFLINAVCPGGYSVGGTACNGFPSWAVYRPIAHTVPIAGTVRT